MKKVYIPKGETVNYAELHTEILIVKGHLKVTGKLTAKSIQGGGTVEAQEIVCDTIALDTVTAEIVTAQKIAVKKLLVRDCRAGEILVADFIEALMVRATKLSMTLSAVEVCEADEIIALPPKKRGILGMLFAAWWRSLLLPNKLPTKTDKGQNKETAQSAKTDTVAESTPEPSISEDFLDVLIDRLEERGFVYDAPYAEPSPLPFAKESAA